jgi:hypothetical protein
MQLNGLGGGISSTSKVCVLSRSERAGCDVDYLFGQVGIKDRRIDWSGSCGNLAAGVGLFALAEGLAISPTAGARIRVWQVNQSYEMILHVSPGVADPSTSNSSAAALELMNLSGVAGREPKVYVELCEPHAGKPLLPTGREVDTLRLPNGDAVQATLVTAGNPTVFVKATAAGLRGTELPSEMDYGAVLPIVDHLRHEAAPLMGIDASTADALRVAFVSEPQAYTASDGTDVPPEAVHLLSRISTPGRIHHAHTGTGAIALACAAGVKGSVPWQCVPDARRPSGGEALSIGHPGGAMEVRAEVAHSEERGWHALGAGFDRTARYLMRGDAFIPPPERAP